MKNEFKESVNRVSQWISDYNEEVEQYPVLSPIQPGEILKQLPKEPNKSPDSFENIFNDFKKIILPGITHWQHPKFFGYFPSNSSPPSVLAEILIASLGVQGMSWATSPAATELEIRMMEWLRDLFGLSTSFSGVIQDSASSSTMIAMIVAREKMTDFAINENGFSSQSLTAYCSSEAHSSVEKGAKMIGLGRHNLRKIPVNDQQEMDLKILETTIQEDIQAGKTPFFVVGAFGTTGSTAIDPLKGISAIAKKYKLWFHVDAAYAGAALVLPEIRRLADGVDEADSVVVNPHKWLLTTFDCSAFFIRNKDALIRTFSVLPEYLKTPEGESVTNFRDWGLGLGRRFRSLKLWFVLRWYGTEGIRSVIRSHIELGKTLEHWIRQDSRFEVVTQRHFNLVCFRLKASNEANMSLLNQLNQSGKLFLSHTKIDEKVVLRMVVGQTHVQERHIRDAWSEIQAIAQGE
jgi:aromatic-L-amino-acid/L-tryptophan decarboxylase